MWENLLILALFWAVLWPPVLYVLKRDKVKDYIIISYFLSSLFVGMYIASLPIPRDDSDASTTLRNLFAITSFPIIALCGWIVKRIYLAIVFRKAKDILVSAYVVITLSAVIYTASLPFPEGGNVTKTGIVFVSGCIFFLAVSLVGSVVYHVCFTIVPWIVRRKQSSA